MEFNKAVEEGTKDLVIYILELYQWYMSDLFNWPWRTEENCIHHVYCGLSNYYQTPLHKLFDTLLKLEYTPEKVSLTKDEVCLTFWYKQNTEVGSKMNDELFRAKTTDGKEIYLAKGTKELSICLVISFVKN